MSASRQSRRNEDAIEVLGNVADSGGESEETSFSSPRGSELLLGSDWAQRPSMLAPKPRRRGRGVVSPSETPAHLTKGSPSRGKVSPDQHVFAEVHVSPQPSPSKPEPKDTVIEIFQTEDPPKDKPKLPPIKPRVRKSSSSATKSGSPSQVSTVPPPQPASKESPATSSDFAAEVPPMRPKVRASSATRSIIKSASASSRVARRKRREKVVVASSTPDPQDFFLCPWASTSEVPVEAPRSPSEDTLLEAGSPEHARFTLEEYFGHTVAQLTLFVDPVKMPSQVNPEVIFYPSAKPVPLESKLGAGVEPRFLEEEGMYVGSRPDIPWRARNKMEQRLLACKSSKHWFGEDGEIVTIEDALREVPLRPLTSDDLDPTLLTYFKEAEVGDGHVSGPPLLLDVVLCSVRFSHHALFGREHVLVQRLTELLRCHARRETDGKTERLAGRLRALRHARDMLETQGRGDDRITRCCEEIREVRGAMLTQGAQDRSLLAALLATWRDLRDLRASQGFVSCPSRLSILREERSERQAREEQERWEEELRRTVEEMMREQAGDSEPRSEKKVRQLATRLLTEGQRPPGEPKLTFEMTHDLEVDPSPSCPKERQRRSLVRRYKLFLQVCYNGQEVCRTAPCGLQDEFSCTLNLALPLSVTQWPQTVTVQLREETSPVTNHLLAEVALPLPARGTTLASASTDTLEFSGAHPCSCMHAPCGLFPTGELDCRAGWGVDGQGVVLEPPDKFWASLARRKPAPSLLKSPDQLRRWADKAKLDPNDPNNAAIFNIIKGGEEVDLADLLTSELTFCSDLELAQNARLRVLELRGRGEPEFSGLKMVPPHQRELPPGVLKEFEDRQQRPRESDSEEISHPEASLASQRAWGRKNLRRIREQVQQQSRLASKRRTLRELVTEDLVPDIGTLGLTFVQWLQPSRPLRPLRKPRKTMASLPGLGREAVLIVNVVSAFQVPVRRESDLAQPTRSSVTSSVVSPGFSTVAVRPFVEVTFLGECCRTAAADGANPTWNQELQLPVRSDCSGQDRISLLLFDEVTVDILEDERLRSVDVHTRQERAWLGEVSFPFSALQLASRIDGTFPLSSPPLLGYERDGQLRQFSGPSASLDSPPSPRKEDGSAATFLTVFITVQPALQPPEPLQERLESAESPEMEGYLDTWLSEVTSEFPDRRLRVLVPDCHGKTVCITRFFRPLPPPGGDVKSPRLPADQAARFVSLISAASPGAGPDIWLSADQVVTLGTADLLPRAALLVCYLQHLGLRAWLLIGWSLGAGPGAFALSRGCGQGGREDELWVWDVSAGRRTTLEDPFCPLSLVWGLVNQDNIWANIQRESSPRRMRFDVARSADWLPAFPPGGAVAAPDPLVASLQPESLRYSETSAEACQDLADRLERVIKDNFMAWRPSLRTRWNRHCSAVLRRVLPSMENYVGRPEQIRELQPLLAAHKMLGFPLQMGFSDEHSVVRALYSTQLHTTRDPDVEFSLAVHVHAWASQVVSVWVYVASLVRRR